MDKTTPVCDPIPPKTTMATIMADSINVKLSGLIKACRVAKKDPANPPNMAPTANAVSLVFLGLTPKDLHAISSSLSASQALPTGNLLILIVNKLVLKAKKRINILKQSNGTAIRINDQEMLEGVSLLSKEEGIFAAPEGGAVLIATKKLRDNGFIKDDDKVVVVNTGSAYKYLDAMQKKFWDD